MSGELIIKKRIGKLTVNERKIVLKIGGAFALTPQYRVYQDMVTLNVDLSYKYIRTGMRSGAEVLDETLTTLGFNGIQNTDWQNIPLALIAASQVEAEAGTEAALRTFSPLRIKQAIDALKAFYAAVSQSEAETGTESGLRSWSPLRVAQAIAALESATPPATTPGGSDKQFQYNNSTAFGGYLDQNTTTFANPATSIDCSLSRNHKVTITGDTTLNLTNHTAGMSGVICLLNDGSGAHTVLLGTMFTKELNGSDDYDATASKYNLIAWYYDGTNVLYSITKEA